MSYQEILDKMEAELKTLLGEFKEELISIKSGRLSPSLVEDIKVDYAGSTLTIKQLGGIFSPAPHEIQLQLWDDSYTEEVIKAIEKENLGLSVRAEGKDIYLSAPPVTEENKERLLKDLSEMKEEFFQRIRRIRDDAWRKIQQGEEGGEIREDDKFRGKDKMEEIVRENRDKMEEMVENKEKEIKR